MCIRDSCNDGLLCRRQAGQTVKGAVRCATEASALLTKSGTECPSGHRSPCAPSKGAGGPQTGPA
eukprot:8413821-Alexandrium_andersonii.AAC.1